MAPAQDELGAAHKNGRRLRARQLNRDWIIATRTCRLFSQAAPRNQPRIGLNAVRIGVALHGDLLAARAERDRSGGLAQELAQAPLVLGVEADKELALDAGSNLGDAVELGAAFRRELRRHPPLVAGNRRAAHEASFGQACERLGHGRRPHTEAIGNFADFEAFFAPERKQEHILPGKQPLLGKERRGSGSHHPRGCRERNGHGSIIMAGEHASSSWFCVGFVSVILISERSIPPTVPRFSKLSASRFPDRSP